MERRVWEESKKDVVDLKAKGIAAFLGGEKMDNKWTMIEVICEMGYADDIMADVLKRCRDMSEKMLMIKYVILYADVKALRFYERNFFMNSSKYMEKKIIWK